MCYVGAESHADDDTRNVTGRHRGPKRKRRHYYIEVRASSPLVYLCAKHLAVSVTELALRKNRVLNHSLSHSPSLFDAPITGAFASKKLQKSKLDLEFLWRTLLFLMQKW